MTETLCKFYEEDTQARLEADEMEKAYIEMIGEENYLKEQQAYAEMEDIDSDSNSEEASCAYCKHLYYGSGFPGEHIVACRCPECSHIIRTEFVESEVI